MPGGARLYGGATACTEGECRACVPPGGAHVLFAVYADAADTHRFTRFVVGRGVARIGGGGRFGGYGHETAGGTGARGGRRVGGTGVGGTRGERKENQGGYGYFRGWRHIYSTRYPHGGQTKCSASETGRGGVVGTTGGAGRGDHDVKGETV